MTKENRKKIHAQLVEAKTRLWDGNFPKNASKYIFICWAIQGDSKGHRPDVYPLARKMVMERLNGAVSVGRYLSNLGIPEKHHTSRNLQEFRHRWLDSLIKEFSR